MKSRLGSPNGVQLALRADHEEIVDELKEEADPRQADQLGERRRDVRMANLEKCRAATSLQQRGDGGTPMVRRCRRDRVDTGKPHRHTQCPSCSNLHE
ncbi:hypothetical protein [Propionivibrio sp.]|uniref:hypothetical protein n=1 Tax=Propionivibrio sp. TaxID=2212460 RepID=UPI0039E25B7C